MFVVYEFSIWLLVQNKLMAVNWHNAISFTVNYLYTYLFCSHTNTLNISQHFRFCILCVSSGLMIYSQRCSRFQTSTHHFSTTHELVYLIQSLIVFARSLFVQLSRSLSQCAVCKWYGMLSTNTESPWTLLNCLQACINWIAVSIESKSAN